MSENKGDKARNISHDFRASQQSSDVEQPIPSHLPDQPRSSSSDKPRSSSSAVRELDPILNTSSNILGARNE